MLHSKITSISSILLISLVFVACDISNSSKTHDWSEMLSNYGNNIILPAFESMQTASNDLESAADNFESEPTLEQLEALQTALKEARLAWQDVSPFQFGPAESILLRSSLNTYPTNTDKINDNISSGEYSFESFDNQDAAGLPALGYLLHGVGDSNEEILTMYTADSEAENRMNYLQDNVSYIKEQVDTATNDWQASGDDYIGMFLSDENAGTDVGSSLSMLFNSYVWHYERFLRDAKIGIPSGIRSAGVKRHTSTEAYYGGYSLELAIANLNQIERIFTGAGGKGLDDELESLDAVDLSDEIQSQMEEAQSALEKLKDPLSQQIEENNDPVLSTFEEIHNLVSLFKSDMTPILNVKITSNDNDGD